MGTTRIGKGRTRVSITLDERCVARADKIAKEGGKSRAEVLAAWVEEMANEEEWSERFFRVCGFVAIRKVYYRTEERLVNLSKWFGVANDEDLEQVRSADIPQEVADCLTEEEWHKLGWFGNADEGEGGNKEARQ